MTDIETKALAVANEVRHEAGYPPVVIMTKCLSDEILVRAIEQHEAFKQEVSDAVAKWKAGSAYESDLTRFIIAKPDPLVEAIECCNWDGDYREAAKELREALAARGLKIVEVV